MNPLIACFQTRDDGEMSMEERQKIYKKVGFQRSGEWCDLRLGEYQEKELVEAFKSYLTEHRNKETAEVWDLLRKGTSREDVLEALSNGVAEVPKFVRDDLRDNVPLKIVFDRFNDEDLGSSLIHEFRNEINEFRLKHRSQAPSISEQQKKSCTLF